MSEDTETRVHLVRYAGRKLAGDNKSTFDKFIIEGKDENKDDGYFVFGTKRGRNFVIGAQYELEQVGEDSFRVAGAKFLGVVEDGNRQRWIAEDRAVQAFLQEEAAKKAAKATEAESLQKMTLEQARVFINGGPYLTQAARTAIVLKALGLA